MPSVFLLIWSRSFAENSVRKALLIFRYLECPKIQAIYFKIYGLYFKISALYFLQDALCFFSHLETHFFCPCFEVIFTGSPGQDSHKPMAKYNP